MSDFSDVLYDPRNHTHESCIKEIPACDMVILIIGSRFGGTAIPRSLEHVDIDAVSTLSSSSELADLRDNISITHLETLKAIEQSILVYAFVDNNVMHDHHVYERNKSNPSVIEHIDFPSIQNRESAAYIFEFINFLSHRLVNNSITSFSGLEEIRTHLTSQWSQLFQKLLHESRTNVLEAKRYRDFSERIEDLKTLMLASISTEDLKATARGALQVRRLVNFVCGLSGIDSRACLLSSKTWDQIFEDAKIVAIQFVESGRMGRPETLLIKSDDTFYSTRLTGGGLERLSSEWDRFKTLEVDARAAIVDALMEDQDPRISYTIQHRNMKTSEYLSKYLKSESEQATDLEDSS